MTFSIVAVISNERLLVTLTIVYCMCLHVCLCVHACLLQCAAHVADILFMQSFRKGFFRCLVATDVAARGLDIPEVDLVVQTEPPSVSERER